MMKKPNNTENELNAIRVEFYEKTKGMSPSEMNAYIAAQIEPVQKEFGMQPINAPKPRQWQVAG